MANMCQILTFLLTFLPEPFSFQYNYNYFLISINLLSQHDQCLKLEYYKRSLLISCSKDTFDILSAFCQYSIGICR